MQVISLFSGIAGFELAAKELGWDVVVSCELNSFCQSVIADYWLHKEEIKEAHGEEQSKLKDDGSWKRTTAEQYYNETFKGGNK